MWRTRRTCGWHLDNWVTKQRLVAYAYRNNQSHAPAECLNHIEWQGQNWHQFWDACVCKRWRSLRFHRRVQQCQLESLVQQGLPQLLAYYQLCMYACSEAANYWKPQSLTANMFQALQQGQWLHARKCRQRLAWRCLLSALAQYLRDRARNHRGVLQRALVYFWLSFLPLWVSLLAPFAFLVPRLGSMCSCCAGSVLTAAGILQHQGGQKRDAQSRRVCHGVSCAMLTVWKGMLADLSILPKLSLQFQTVAAIVAGGPHMYWMASSLRRAGLGAHCIYTGGSCNLDCWEKQSKFYWDYQAEDPTSSHSDMCGGMISKSDGWLTRMQNWHDSKLHRKHQKCQSLLPPRQLAGPRCISESVQKNISLCGYVYQLAATLPTWDRTSCAWFHLISKEREAVVPVLTSCGETLTACQPAVWSTLESTGDSSMTTALFWRATAPTSTRMEAAGVGRVGTNLLAELWKLCCKFSTVQLVQELAQLTHHGRCAAPWVQCELLAAAAPSKHSSGQRAAIDDRMVP